jgi:hypothetical protein
MKPILFKTEMVQAILAGRKTQTRRVIKHFGNLYHYDTLLCDWALSDKPKHIGGVNWEWTLQTAVDDNSTFKFKCPYGKIGEILWVRETFAKTGDNFHDDWPDHGDYYYKADNPFNEIELHKEYPKMKGWPKWRPSIYISRKAARIFLKIADIKVERLQDINEMDAIAEGVLNADSFKNIGVDNSMTNRYAYRELWDKINSKKYPWSSNPWVWVITFKRIDKSNE